MLRARRLPDSNSHSIIQWLGRASPVPLPHQAVQQSHVTSRSTATGTISRRRTRPAAITEAVPGWDGLSETASRRVIGPLVLAGSILLCLCRRVGLRGPRFAARAARVYLNQHLRNAMKAIQNAAFLTHDPQTIRLRDEAVAKMVGVMVSTESGLHDPNERLPLHPASKYEHASAQRRPGERISNQRAICHARSTVRAVTACARALWYSGVMDWV